MSIEENENVNRTKGRSFSATFRKTTTVTGLRFSRYELGMLRIAEKTARTFVYPALLLVSTHVVLASSHLKILLIAGKFQEKN